MKSSRHPLVILAVVLGLGVILLRATPGLAEDLGFDFWNYDRFESEWQECKQRNSRLDQIQEQTRWRMQVRDNLVADFFAGRTTVEETIRQFIELNRTMETGVETMMISCNCKTERGVALRMLRVRFASNPEQFPGRDTLQAEVETLLQQELMN